MSVYCISYTLKVTGNVGLIAAIKSYGFWWHESETVWFIQSTHSAEEILDNLKKLIAANDKLLVIEVARHWWGIGYTQEEYNWLKAREF